MIPKSGYRFSEKIMLKDEDRAVKTTVHWGGGKHAERQS